MKPHRAALCVTLAAATLLACGKKASSPPTAPPPTPQCTLSAPSLTFGNTLVGTTTDRQFSITNSGSGTLSGTVSSGCADFTIVGQASYSLDAGQSRQFTVRFTPSGAGARACTLSTGQALCPIVVCSGTGEVTAPACFLQTPELDFGTLLYGRTATRTIAFQNSGGGMLTGSISGATVDFTFLDPTTFSLGPGQWANIRARFMPTSAGTQRCTLQVNSTTCGPIVLRGIGQLEFAGNCNVGVISDTLDFGEVSIGFTSERTFTLKNFSTNYRARGSVGGVCPEFAVVTAGVLDLLPGNVFEGRVGFSPTREGPQTCAIPVSCLMEGSGTNAGVNDYVICRGVGVGGTPQCELSATTLDFGRVSVGQTKDLPIQITNTGTGTLSGAAGPSHCGVFSFVGSAKYSLGPGESATLTVLYTPTQVGHTTTCSAVPMGLDCAAVAFVGEAVAPPSCALNTTLLDFGSVPVGQSAQLTFDLENSGGGTLCGTMTEACPDFTISRSSYCVTPPAFIRTTVTFTPGSAGFRQCTIQPGGGCPPITVRGTGS